MTLTEMRIQKLADSVHKHAALNNVFYPRWIAGTLSFHDVERFACHYLAHSRQTIAMIACAFLSIEDVALRTLLARNLYEMHGDGEPAKARLVLLERYLTDLLSRIAGRRYSPEELAVHEFIQVRPSRGAFNLAPAALSGSHMQAVNPCRTTGNLFAQECLMVPTLTRLYEGARHYRYLYPDSASFYTQCAYFYASLGNTAKRYPRQREMIKVVARMCLTPEDFAEFSAGFHCYLENIAEYWAGLASQMAFTSGVTEET